MTPYNWKIMSMEVKPELQGHQDVVFSVDWLCFALDDNISAEAMGTVELGFSGEGAFTPYENLSEAEVLNWIMPSIDKAEIEANLQALINDKKAPAKKILPLPW